MSSTKRLVPGFFVLAVCMAVVCDAQTFRGGISGRVVDETGGVLPGVTVTETNTATGDCPLDDNVSDR